MVNTKKETKAAKPAAEPVKAAETKAAAPVKAEETKTASASVKEPAEAEKAPVKRRTAKEAAPKKTAAKPAAPRKAKEPKTTVYVQFDGKEIVAKDVLDEALKAYKKSHRGVEIKDVQVYIVANENAAYYVVNGEASDEFRIEL